ncbi:MBOAT family O-acyltransferase [Nitrosopumilus ureiphilus]|uniref:Alginate O-acetyltransferase n=1 Tax=Nitrosopumilus ureiphilus TaxID=1470067 RepID=A0A7D5M9X9_9ARCH|nr:MBOAT family protein [Nitrosopumilus ureiphilus]QLH06669.1 alginate O-acetyltransferase [Nitrosopumilus ureiphilus]
MLFNTIDFIVFFILVVTTIVIVKNRNYQHLFLLIASYFFFYYSSNYLISLLIFSTVLDFYVAKKIHQQKNNPAQKKILLITSLVGNLGLLGFFKYADFAIAQFNFFGSYFNLADEIPFLYIALPIGISFYTFQTISYTVDVYREKLEPSKSLKEFALFVAFFPQLVAGPILRASDFLPQLREKIKSLETVSSSTIKLGKKIQLSKISINSSNLKLGITIMGFGFVKKMFFADNIAPLVDEIFSNPMGLESFSIILGAIGFGIQIYADFSGYSDIAIGIATVLGFKIPINFNRPYFATSPRDFWKRWHISLSTWLRDYLYIPLGGSKKSSVGTYGNLFAVMILGGIWHGAAWNFVVWGLLHGAYLAVTRFFGKKFPQFTLHPFFSTRIGKIISILTVQYFVFLAWIPFRVQNFDFMLYSMQKYVLIDFATEKTLELISSNKISVFLIVVFIITCIISYKKNIHQIASNLSLKKWTLVMTLFAVIILVLYDGSPQDFIYFKF